MGGKEGDGEERETGEREAPNHHSQKMPYRQPKGWYFTFFF